MWKWGQFLSAVLLLVWIGPTAFGQEEADEKEEDVAPEVIVTADRMESTEFDSPYSISKLTADDIIHRIQARNIPEALAEIEGLSIQETARGHGSPFIRGLTGFRNLYLIDGIRLNNSVFRSGPIQYLNTIDAWILDDIQVLKGATGVPWGSDALGGTVLMTTLAPEFDEDGADQGFARVVGRGASADRSTAGRLEFSGTQGNFGILGGTTIRDLNDLDAGRHTGEIQNTEYSRRDGDFKAVYQPFDGAEWVGVYQGAFLRNVPRTHKTVFSVPFQGTTVGSEERRDTDQERHLGYLQFRWDAPDEFDGNLTKATASLSYHLQKERLKKVKTSSNLGTTEGWEAGSLGLWFQIENETPYATLVWGAEYYHDFVSSFRRETDLTTQIVTVFPRGPIADDAEYDLGGLFLQGKIEFGDWGELLAGIRYQIAHVDANEVDPDPADALVIDPLDETYDAVVGSGRFLFKFSDSWNGILGISQGFRTPNLDDTTAFRDRRTGTYDIPSPGVNPERTITLDAGFKFDDEEWGKGKAFFFYTFLQDFIERVPTGVIDPILGDEFRKENFKDGFIYGFEVASKVRFTEKEVGLYFLGNFSFTEGRGETLVGGQKKDRFLSRIPPMKGRIGIGWENEDEDRWVEAFATVVKEQNNLSPGDQGDTDRIPPGGTPGYTIFTVRGGIEFEEDWKLSAAVENITNKDYRVHGSGDNGPGTNAIITLDFTF